MDLANSGKSPPGLIMGCFCPIQLVESSSSMAVIEKVLERWFGAVEQDGNGITTFGFSISHSDSFIMWAEDDDSAESTSIFGNLSSSRDIFRLWDHRSKKSQTQTGLNY